MSRARLKAERSWEVQAALETVLYNELQALRGEPKRFKSERDEAILEAITLTRRVVKRYERLMGIRLWVKDRKRVIKIQTSSMYGRMKTHER